MPEFDLDLQSIQEARTLAAQAHEAQKQFMHASQAEVDRVCAAMVEAGYAAAERLGRLAVEETGYGVPEHKTLKNILSTRILWDSIKDIRTVGVIRHDPARKLYDIAWPVGVVAALTPSTNPTSTGLFKTLIAVKAKNGIIVAPHPAAARCTGEAVRVIAEAGEKAGMPHGLVGWMTRISLRGTQELMAHKYVSLILATGGSEMVKAAHSVGKPAYGVGPGNVPVYVDRSADLRKAARYIVASKAFDHSVICATEQAVVADKPIAAQLEELMKAEGACFVDKEQAQILARLLFPTGYLIDPKTVGKSPQQLAQMCGISVPDSARILVARLSSVGKEEPLSGEKLTTVLGWYEANGWEAGCERCIELIHHGGRGHSLVIHAQDDNVIMRFGLEKPVFRIVANTMGTLGTTGMTTGVMPSMTLGPGGFGGAITGDNITVHHMYNVKRLAYEINPPPETALVPGSTDPQIQQSQRAPAGQTSIGLDNERLEEIVRRVLAELGK
ncbi:MAG TPA: aldehyde dehydrogenase family protein [Anaerolineaceae bacterium]|nr:aldehyde dehydrogenase family protein [Anaerolineaceae bacterium]